MTTFNILYLRRSDGKLEVVTRNRQKERNEPTKEQLDATPNSKGVSDYYRPLGQNDAKHLDWRKKLGGMLVRQIGGTEHTLGKLGQARVRHVYN